MFSAKKPNKKARLLLTVEYPPNNGGVGRYLKSIVDEVGEVEVIRPQFFKFFWPHWLKSLIIPLRLRPQEMWVSHLLPLGYVALIYKIITGTPYTIFVHGTDIQFAAKSKWKQFWAKVILKYAKQIIANSQYTASLIKKLKIDMECHPRESACPPPQAGRCRRGDPEIITMDSRLRGNDRFQVIYPCPTFTSEISVNKKPQSLLSVGRLVPRKGFAQGVKAAAQLKKEFSALTYTIIGQGTEYQNLKNIILENQAEQYIKIITDASDEVLQQYYAQSEILLAPGQEIAGDVEGFGLVILEAAQFTTPAIATNVGGVGEAIVDEQTGILIRDNEMQTIVDAVSKLFKGDELRENIGKAAKIRVEQDFKMKEQIKKLTS